MKSSHSVFYATALTLCLAACNSFPGGPQPSATASGWNPSVKVADQSPAQNSKQDKNKEAVSAILKDVPLGGKVAELLAGDDAATATLKNGYMWQVSNSLDEDTPHQYNFYIVIWNPKGDAILRLANFVDLKTQKPSGWHVVKSTPEGEAAVKGEGLEKITKAGLAILHALGIEGNVSPSGPHRKAAIAARPAVGQPRS
jgi:hypothetical protein